MDVKQHSTGAAKLTDQAADITAWEPDKAITNASVYLNLLRPLRLHDQRVYLYQRVYLHQCVTVSAGVSARSVRGGQAYLALLTYL